MMRSHIANWKTTKKNRQPQLAVVRSFKTGKRQRITMGPRTIAEDAAALGVDDPMDLSGEIEEIVRRPPSIESSHNNSLEIFWTTTPPGMAFETMDRGHHEICTAAWQWYVSTAPARRSREALEQNDKALRREGSLICLLSSLDNASQDVQDFHTTPSRTSRKPDWNRIDDLCARIRPAASTQNLDMCFKILLFYLYLFRFAVGRENMLRLHLLGYITESTALALGPTHSFTLVLRRAPTWEYSKGGLTEYYALVRWLGMVESAGLVVW